MNNENILIGWDIIKDHLGPHSGTIILSTILFVILGFFIGLIYVITLSKFKVFKRIPKYYNWIVKLYIPLIIAGFLFVFFSLGLIRGAYKAVNKEKPEIVNGLYSGIVGNTFESELSKNEFFKGVQNTVKISNGLTHNLVEVFKNQIIVHNTGSSIIDVSKNKMANYLADEYGDEVFKLGVYTLFHAGVGYATKGHASADIPYDQFSKMMDVLIIMSNDEIEVKLKEQIDLWITEQIDSSFKGLKLPLYIILFLIALIPIIEFLIYKKWVEHRYSNNNISLQ